MLHFKPIFIGGCSRSGTTFLGSLLGTHKSCLCTPESQFKVEILQTIGKETNKNAYLQLVNNYRFKIWDINYPFEQFNGLPPKQIIENIITIYARNQGKQKFDYWIDHTPNNLQYAKLLLGYFPNAKFIHIIRDGRAIASSIKKLSWGWYSPKSIAQLWLTELSYGFATECALSNDKVIQIKYEDLIMSTDNVLKTLCNFIDIEYSDALLRGNGFRLPTYTRDQHTLVGRKPQVSRINAWIKDLSARYIELFEYYAGNMLVMNGYKLINQSIKPPSFYEKFFYQVIQILKTYNDKKKLRKKKDDL